ncbi:MAG: TlpA family protein disulfide reductase [Clostridia bacterium]|nr:TlpA family protein disulfide reductase [Clostridia bacterium]
MRAARKAYHGTLAYQKKRNKVLEICAWALALLILAAALIYYNVIAEEAVAEVSYEVGDTVSSFTLKKYFGEEDETYTLQDDLDDGKIVILNFWYIGCQPCQEELPEFGEVAEEYSDEVSLVVIHSSTVSTGSVDLLETYVADEKYMGWDFWAYDNVSFTLDNSGEQSVYTAMQGTNAYPMTVILNSDGVITARYASKIDKATLESEIKSILNG